MVSVGAWDGPIKFGGLIDCRKGTVGIYGIPRSRTYLSIHRLAVAPANLRVCCHRFISAAQGREVGPVSRRSPARVLWDVMSEAGAAERERGGMRTGK